MANLTIKAVRIVPGMKSESIEIENTLQAFQKEVGGYIQTTVSDYPGTTYVVNEEGKIKKLPFNFFLKGDYIVGTAIAVGLGNNGEDFVSLTEEQEAYYLEKYSTGKTK